MKDLEEVYLWNTKYLSGVESLRKSLPEAKSFGSEVVQTASVSSL